MAVEDPSYKVIVYFQNNYHARYLKGSHTGNLSICPPTFTSSDWSTHAFVIGTSQTRCNMPRKFMPVKEKQKQKVEARN